MASKKPANKLQEAQDKELIHIVKANDWIFNKEKRYSYNEESKAHFWQKICTKLAERGFSVPDPKARWQQLREQFVRHDKNGNRKWIYSADMSFLLSHIRHKDKLPTKSHEWQNSSSNLTMVFQVESLGNEASTSNDFFTQRLVLVVATGSHSTENELQPQGVVQLARVLTSCSPQEFDIPHDNFEPFSDVGTLQLIDHVQPIANEYEFDPPGDLDIQYTNDIQTPLSKSSLATPLEDTNWGQISETPHISSRATSTEPIVNSEFSPDCAVVDDSSCLTRVLVQSVPLPSERSVIDMGYEITPPIERITTLTMRGNSTSVIPPVDTSFRIPLSDSSCGSSSGFSSASSSQSSPAGRRASPLTAPQTSGVRSVRNTNNVAESSRVSTHLVQKNPPNSCQRRPIAVPCSDAFSKKKKKEASKSETTEEAIMECSSDLRKMSSEFTDLIRLKKELVQARLQEGRVEVDNPRKSTPQIESGDGFFNLLQKEWLGLPLGIQDELFSEILDVMEEFEVE